MTDSERISGRAEAVHRLHAARPRSRFARWSGIAFVGLVAVAWTSPALRPGDFLSPRRLANLRRFLGELVPYPLQQGEGENAARVAVAWSLDMLGDKGWSAAGTSLALSVAAIVLVGALAAVCMLVAARTLATPEPYVESPRTPSRLRQRAWRALAAGTRAVLVFLRSIPEYIWAFLLLAILGPGVWPLVLALALHNLGILGKLDAEVVENLDPAPMAALRGLGAGRLQIATAAILPLSLPRLLLFFFYRWETCVREATVLGMLGVVSLGYWIVDSRARNHYDEMFFFVLLGAALVLLGDLLSAVARTLVRRAS
ncbi:MAG: ABC transporter permease subunit [Thermoanaerobaculia bacterium]|nr:ABC transporter permease subunit [Thermoanaerobaculia bacterium]